MSQRTKEQLKALFQTGDQPTEQDFIDVFDSLQPTIVEGNNVTLTEEADGTVKIDVNKTPSDNSLTTSMYQDNSVTNSKLADNSIDDRVIQDGAITNSKLATDSVQNENIVDETITKSKLSPDIKFEIDDNSITPHKLSNSIIESNNQLCFFKIEMTGTVGAIVDGTPTPSDYIDSITGQQYSGNTSKFSIKVLLKTGYFKNIYSNIIVIPSAVQFIEDPTLLANYTPVSIQNVTPTAGNNGGFEIVFNAESAPTKKIGFNIMCLLNRPNRDI